MSKVKSQKSKVERGFTPSLENDIALKRDRKSMSFFSAGFTILETILAITVVSLAIAGATGAVRTGLIGASIAKEQVTAFYLAQEAIEILRNKRDANVLGNYVNGTTNNWLAGITGVGDPCEFGRTCTLDTTTYTLSNSGCSGWNSCPYLRQNPTSFLYGYDGSWNQTSYRREIQIENIVGVTDEVIINVQISWIHGATQRSFKTKTTLNNWF